MLAPDIDPVAIHLGPLKIHWYGLMYLIGFLGAWWLGVLRAKRPGSGWRPEEIAGLLFYGLLGVILAMWLYARRTRRRFFAVADFVALLTPLGLGAGRLGNFINHELWGRVTDVPWGMVFPGAGPLPRHPSQLYEFMLEGVALFLILWFYARKPRPTSAVSGLFLLCYGTFRFLVEFAREPDAHLGYLAFGWLTMGQVLSLPMILFGIGLIWWAYRNKMST